MEENKLLTVGEVAILVGVSIYTIKRWYKWYESEDVTKLNELVANGMPPLPKCETIGATNWRYWRQSDIEDLIKFKNFIPHTRGGFMGSLNKKEKENGRESRRDNQGLF